MLQMMCPNCNHNQSAGKFCENCGGQLVGQQNAPDPSQYTPNVNYTNPHIDPSGTATIQHQQPMPRGESAFSVFFSNFFNLVKNPTEALKAGESAFGRAIISLVLFAVAFGIGFYTLINSALSKTVNSYGSLFAQEEVKLPFFEVVMKTSFFALAFLAIGFVSMLIMVKGAKSPLSPKTLIAQYGGLVVPFVIVNVVAIVLAFAESYELAPTLLLLSLVFVTYFVPLMLTFENTKNLSNQRVYLSFAASFLAMVVSYFFVKNMVVDYLEDLERLTSIF
jgi:hypothetical protein